MSHPINRRSALSLLGGVTASFLPFHGAAGAEPDSPSPLNGEALFIVFPDYPVNTDTVYGYTELVGHAGVLMIAANGLTKYYEFGRYGDVNGRTRSVSVPNVTIGADGRATQVSITPVLAALSEASGANGRIRAAYFIRMDFNAMLSKASAAQPTYSVTDYNCGQYAREVIRAGNSGIDHPCVVNPMPNNIVDEYIEEGNAEVTYEPGSGKLTIGNGDEDDAKEISLAIC